MPKIKSVKLNIKNMKDAELEKELVSLRESMHTLRFKAQGSKSKDVKEPAKLKKNVARVLTEMQARKSKSVK